MHSERSETEKLYCEKCSSITVSVLYMLCFSVQLMRGDEVHYVLG